MMPTFARQCRDCLEYFPPEKMRKWERRCIACHRHIQKAGERLRIDALRVAQSMGFFPKEPRIGKIKQGYAQHTYFRSIAVDDEDRKRLLREYHRQKTSESMRALRSTAKAAYYFMREQGLLPEDMTMASYVTRERQRHAEKIRLRQEHELSTYFPSSELA